MHRYIPKFNCTKVPILSKSSSANENCSSFPSHSQLSREIGLVPFACGFLVYRPVVDYFML